MILLNSGVWGLKSGGHTPHPGPVAQWEVPGLAGAREIANAREVTRQLRAIYEPVAKVTSAVEEVVGLRPGDRRPRWLTALMKKGGSRVPVGLL